MISIGSNGINEMVNAQSKRAPWWIDALAPFVLIPATVYVLIAATFFWRKP